MSTPFSNPFSTGPTASGAKTPNGLADEFSKLDLPNPSGFQFTPAGARRTSKAPAPINLVANRQSLDGGSALSSAVADDFVNAEEDQDDLTAQLSGMNFPEPEQVSAAARHKRTESMSEELSSQLSAMKFPRPERIFGGDEQEGDDVKRNGSLSEELSTKWSTMKFPRPERIFGGDEQEEDSGKSPRTGVNAKEWDNIQLPEGQEVPEAVRRGSIVGISSPRVGELGGEPGRFNRERLDSVVEEVKQSATSATTTASNAASSLLSSAQSALASAASSIPSLPSVISPSAAVAQVKDSISAATTTAKSTAEQPSETIPKGEGKGQVVTPWDVQGEVGADGVVKEIDYNKLVEQFGTKLISPELVARFERLTGRKAHQLLRRGTFFSHRDLDKILDRYEAGKPFYLYTGRGPSLGSMHMGHQIPFMFTQWLQDVFDCPLVIQLTDDEKFLMKPALKMEEVHASAYENAKDIIACGFKPEKTFIFSDLDYVGGAFYWNICRIAKAIPQSQSKATFGFTETDNVGKYHFVAIQAAPSFSNSFPQIFGLDSSVPCLIPCAIDQDPYFRLTRDVATKLKYPKPCLIHCKFLPALQGAQTKMSASDPNTAIYFDDTPNKIKNKINKHGFSGGGDTEELHRANGGNPDVDVAFQYLSFFEEDDEKIARIAADYRAGTLLTGQLKAMCIKMLQEEVAKYQARKAAVSKDVLMSFMDPKRKIDPTPGKAAVASSASAPSA